MAKEQYVVLQECYKKRRNRYYYKVVFKVDADKKLQGKQQKEIDLYSQQTISAKMKSARERNLCETTEELMAKYAKEKEQ